jgi:hypothetical protein
MEHPVRQFYMVGGNGVFVGYHYGMGERKSHIII